MLVGFSSGHGQGGRSGHWPLLWKLSSVQPLLVTAGGQRGKEDQPLHPAAGEGRPFLLKSVSQGGGQQEVAPRKAPWCQASPLASSPPKGPAETPNPHQVTWGGEGDSKPGGGAKKGGGQQRSLAGAVGEGRGKGCCGSWALSPQEKDQEPGALPKGAPRDISPTPTAHKGHQASKGAELGSTPWPGSFGVEGASGKRAAT